MWNTYYINKCKNQTFFCGSALWTKRNIKDKKKKKLIKIIEFKTFDWKQTVQGFSFTIIY